MSSGTQVDLDWAGADPSLPTSSPNSANGGAISGTGTYLSDEEILGLEPVGRARLSVSEVSAEADATSKSSHGALDAPRVDGQAAPREGSGQGTQNAMPAWMQTLAADPQHGAEAQQLWQEHQEFRAAFASPAEAQALKQSAQSVERIDAAIFSGDTRAQSEVVAEIARANPAAFRSLFAEAARVLEGMGQAQVVAHAAPALRETREAWGTQQTQNSVPASEARNLPSISQDNRQRDFASGLNDGPPRNDPAHSMAVPQFDPAAYASFERTTNDVVARDVRSTIGDTLARVLPEGVAEGAARRIGDDIFNEIHRALAADARLSQQVGETLRASVASGQGWRFGLDEQQRVTALLAGRARQLVPSVARRVIGEWTGSVLGTARAKSARQAAAAARVDIAAPGGSADSMPLRPMSAREVNYASMSDDEILGM